MKRTLLALAVSLVGAAATTAAADPSTSAAAPAPRGGCKTVMVGHGAARHAVCRGGAPAPAAATTTTTATIVVGTEHPHPKVLIVPGSPRALVKRPTMDDRLDGLPHTLP